MTVETVRKRHPIRGGLYGILLGLGLMFIFVGQSWAALGTWPPVLLFVGGIVFGVLWGFFAPPKKPKGEPPPPTPAATSAAAEPERPSPPEEPEGDDSSEASQAPD